MSLMLPTTIILSVLFLVLVALSKTEDKRLKVLGIVSVVFIGMSVVLFAASIIQAFAPRASYQQDKTMQRRPAPMQQQVPQAPKVPVPEQK
jgi:hypothetical protein